MKKFFATLILFSLISLNFTWCENTKDSDDTAVKTEKSFFPKVGIIKIWENSEKEFSVNWEVFPEKESVFVSKVPDWVVKKINVKAWDYVKKWQVLMEINSDKTLQNYVNARNNYNKAVASWNQNIRSASINLENTKSISEKQWVELTDGLSNSKSSINLSIQKAESDLESIKKINQKTEKAARENLENFLKTAKILSENSLNEIDKILWIEDVNEEGALKYENYLWNLKSETLSIAKDNYRLAKKFFDENKNSSEQKEVLEILKKIKISSDSDLELLKNSTTWPNFTNAELQWLITKFSNLSNSIQSSINSLISLQNALDTTLESNQKNLIMAQNVLEIAKNEWENWNSKKNNFCRIFIWKKFRKFKKFSKKSRRVSKKCKSKFSTSDFTSFG